MKTLHSIWILFPIMLSGCNSSPQPTMASATVTVSATKPEPINPSTPEGAKAHIVKCLDSWKFGDDHASFIRKNNGKLSFFNDSDWDIHKYKLRKYEIIGVREDDGAFEVKVILTFDTTSGGTTDVPVIYYVYYYNSWHVSRTSK